MKNVILKARPLLIALGIPSLITFLICAAAQKCGWVALTMLVIAIVCLGLDVWVELADDEDDRIFGLPHEYSHLNPKIHLRKDYREADVQFATRIEMERIFDE